MFDNYTISKLQNLAETGALSNNNVADGAFRMLESARIGSGAFDVYTLHNQLIALNAADPEMAASLQFELMPNLNIVEQAQLQKLQQQAPQQQTAINRTKVPADVTTQYVVKKGDTEASLCAKFSVTPFELLVANFENAQNSPNGLPQYKPGTVVNIPQGQSAIVVKPNEKLGDIAKTYGVTEAQILRTNGYEKAADIRPGDRLLIVPQNETGLDKDQAVMNFVTDMKSLTGPNSNSDNGKWTLNDKEKFLEKTINAQLTKLGIPNLDIKVSDLGKQGLANYNPEKHQITIDKKFLAMDLSKPENLQLLTQAVYHEARHAEQFFNLARIQASLTTGSPKEIAEKIQQNTGMSKALATAAAKAPMDMKSADATYFMAMYESIYGKGKANAANVYKNLTDGNVTDSDKEAYRRLPMELDAFRVSAKVDFYF